MTKKLDDNTVRYCLYPNLNDDNDYELYLNNCLGKLANYLTNYYWYYTSFNLKFINKEFSHSKVSHIEGCTNFDENIEDEWFIVFLLIELTKHDNNLIIELEDSDGYFLLIEAADYLPKWVNPKTSLNRCFLFRGKLHLIEPNKNELNKLSSNSKIVPPTIEDALKIIRDEQTETECSNDIQNQLLHRINDYPFKLNNLLHKSIVRIPTSIAYLLDRQPKLITHSIRAFYNRDDTDLSICRLMKTFHPKYLVKKIIKIPKFNYAQLMAQNFKPDSKLNWYNTNNSNNSSNSDCSIYNSTCSNNSKITSNTTTTSLKTSLTTSEKNEIHKQYDLGFKISCGFEILISNYKSTINKLTKQSTINDHLSRQSTKWLIFLDNLKKNNYFDNLIDNSIEYENKLREAKEYFDNSVLVDFNSDGAFIEYKLIGKLINDLLNDNQFIDNEIEYFNKFKNDELNISIDDQDSDEWLNELPDFILNDNQLMNDNYFELPNKITNRIENFMNSNSDYKGVELENCLIDNSETIDNFDNLISNSETSDQIENPKKRKSDLKERALKMMSDNLRSIITMKIDSDTDHTETDLSDYDYSDNSSNEDLNDINELKYLKQNLKNKQNKKFRDVNERKKRKKSKNTDKEMKKIMNEMDKELSATTIGKTFDKLSLNKATIKSTTNVPMANCAEFDEDYQSDDERATLNENDIKFNTVKNLLDSFKEQNGLSGPTSNLLNSLGVNLPIDDENLLKDLDN